MFVRCICGSLVFDPSPAFCVRSFDPCLCGTMHPLVDRLFCSRHRKETFSLHSVHLFSPLAASGRGSRAGDTLCRGRDSCWNCLVAAAEPRRRSLQERVHCWSYSLASEPGDWGIVCATIATTLARHRFPTLGAPAGRSTRTTIGGNCGISV